MENHPIPQNVTGFKFKLIGDMTVKQFAYLASGAFFAWLSFILPLPIFIKAPFSLFFAILGFSLAFIPFEGRPLDTMISYFVRALFVPNQFIYRKIGIEFVNTSAIHKKLSHPLAQPAVSQDKLESYLRSVSATSAKNPLDEKENTFFSMINNLSQSAAPATVTPPPTPSLPQSPPAPTPVQLPPQQFVASVPLSSARIITQEEYGQKQPIQIHQAPKLTLPTQPENKPEVPEGKQKFDAQVETLKQELERTKAQLTQNASSPSLSEQAHRKLLELEQQLSDVLFQREKLQTELVSLRKKIVSNDPSQAVIPQPIIQSVPKRTFELPTPSAPNQLTGLVRDPRNNLLPNILVEVKDQEGNSVRAFKTNPLGQFSSATPLAPGTYTISFEDPQSKHGFEDIVLNVANALIEPLEIISEDEREKLRKALFN